MTTSELTGSDLRQAVYRLIARELGTAALVQFIQENYPGQGDYTAERQIQPQPTVEQILEDLKKGGQGNEPSG